MEKSQKISSVFHCELCHYNTSKKSDYDKHLLTSKHKNNVELNDLEKKVVKNRKKYICCNCNKIYNARNSLWYHEKVCKETHEHNESDIDSDKDKDTDKFTDKELIMMLIKENSELKNMMMKVLENGTHNTTNNTTTTNSHNKSFNLQFFLNETCKDAMNIMDFVDSIKIQLTDLERVGELGYVEGISNIIVKNLKELDVTQRPVHCTDKKREVLYVKDEDKWAKDEEKKKMRQMVKKVADKNSRLITKFKESHPDCNKSSSKYADQYNKLIVESMGGQSDDDDHDKEEKIIKKISKEIIVEKND